MNALPKENLSINISTVNGTGSLSANQLLTKILFRSGWSVACYNFFPSNIAGLPCLYSLRLNSKNYKSFTNKGDLLICLNPKNIIDNLNELKPQGLLVSDQKDKIQSLLNTKNQEQDLEKILHYTLPISQSLKEIQNIPPKQRALFKNIIYVGLLCEWLKIKADTVTQSIEDLFGMAKGCHIVEQNLQMIRIGRHLASQKEFPFSIPEKINQQKKTAKKDLLIDGNSAMALGALSAGCQFLSWYPITPASSIAERFEKFANLYQKDSQGKNKFLVLQSEDELSSISHVIGAGWAGIRAMTVTSGPGLSLISEGAGLAYFAEIPSVLCQVQRAGPSTGLPTRVQQADLISSCFLSHGDSKHIVLIPANPKEAFDFTKKAFDLAEELQTLVIVLSDLDLGMNLRMSESFNLENENLKRGKVLSEKDLKTTPFQAYRDVDGDGVSYRTLPGIRHEKGAYLNRGSGHNIEAEYSEKHQDYSDKLDKLERKWQTAKKMMPEPIFDVLETNEIAFVTFGTNEDAVQELRQILQDEDIPTNYMRIVSFPFPQSVEDFLQSHTKIFIVEQNRDGQLKKILCGEFPKQSHKMESLLQYDGRPIFVENIKNQFYKMHSEVEKSY